MVAHNLRCADGFRSRQRQPMPSLGSRDQPAANADGSFDLYLGPTAPAGKEKNWLRKAQAPQTVAWTVSMRAVELFVMPKRLSAMEKDRWLGHCGWCNRELGEQGERIAIKARFRDEKDYRKHEGMVVSFIVAQRSQHKEVKMAKVTGLSGNEIYWIIR